MKAVLHKVVARQLDTNLSVAAITDLDGAIEGIRAVEKNLLPGKILVYPSKKGLTLTPIGDKRWTIETEKELLHQSPCASFQAVQHARHPRDHSRSLGAPG
jgi:hypothetical protein